MLCRISGYTVVEALANLRCARTALPEYWPLARTRAPAHVGREVALVQRQFNTTEAKRSKAALGRIIIAMDYDQSGIARTYDEARALTRARRRRWQRLLSAHIDRTAISLVVDLGCGTGRFSEMLAAELGARVIGLDPSEKMIDQARRKPAASPVVIWAGISTRASAPGGLR